MAVALLGARGAEERETGKGQGDYTNGWLSFHPSERVTPQA